MVCGYCSLSVSPWDGSVVSLCVYLDQVWVDRRQLGLVSGKAAAVAGEWQMVRLWDVGEPQVVWQLFLVERKVCCAEKGREARLELRSWAVAVNRRSHT